MKRIQQSTLKSSTSLIGSVEQEVFERDKQRCLLCGRPCSLVVTPIISDGSWQAHWLRRTGISPGFTKNGAMNFMTLCPNHEDDFREHNFALVPCLEDIQALATHEESDWESREQIVLSGGQDPGRSVPSLDSLTGVFDYIYVHGSATQLGTWGISVSGPFGEREEPNDVQYPPKVRYVNIFPQGPPVVHTQLSTPSQNNQYLRLLVHLNVGTLRVDPWALICHALSGLNSAFCADDIGIASVGDGGQLTDEIAYPNPLPEIEARILHLRNLYNRFRPSEVPPSPILSTTTESTGTLSSTEI